jgi:hypothetical protein
MRAVNTGEWEPVSSMARQPIAVDMPLFYSGKLVWQRPERGRRQGRYNFSMSDQPPSGRPDWQDFAIVLIGIAAVGLLMGLIFKVW